MFDSISKVVVKPEWITSLYIGLFSCFLLLGIWKKCSVRIKKKRTKLGVAGYSVIYADQKAKTKKQQESYGKLLYSAKYDIQGKPDYIFKSYMGNRLIPVEIKSGYIGDEDMPHRGDLLQLVAYFLILEDVFGVKPRYGRLVYSDYMFIIKNTDKLRKEVKGTLSSMRQMLKDGEGEANSSFVKCRYCICRGTVCEYCEDNSKKKGEQHEV